MSKITIEQEKQIIVIMTYIILIHFKIIVFFGSKPAIPSCCFFQTLHLHWHICHKSIKCNRWFNIYLLIDAFLRHLSQIHV